MAESVRQSENKEERIGLITREDLVIAIKKEVEVKPEPHECVVCLVRSQDTYDIFCTNTSASGASLHSFLSKYTRNELGNAQQCPKYVCKGCCDLINVLEQAEIEYIKLKETFEAIISKNPLFHINLVQPIQLSSVKNELGSQTNNVLFDDYDIDSEDEPLSLTKKKRRKPAKKRKKTTPVKRKTKVKPSLDESKDMDMLEYLNPMDQPLSKRKKNWTSKIKLVVHDLHEMKNLSSSAAMETSKTDAYDLLHDIKDIPLSDTEANKSVSEGNCELTIIRPRPTKSLIRPIKLKKLTIDLFYGSEEDSDDDDRYALTTLLSVPRIVRDVYIEDEDDQPLPEKTMPPIADESPAPPLSTRASSPLPSNQAPLQPTDIFNFQWRPFPNPEIAPSSRRETFLERDIGPKCVYDKQYAAFTAIWDRKIMDHISTQTNLYAKQYTDKMAARKAKVPGSKVHAWIDINTDELYVHFAIILAMGIVVKPRVVEYWSKNKDIFVTPAFCAYMSYNRFITINKFLHFNDNSLLNKENYTRPQAKLYKLQPLIEHLNEKFSQLYTLDRNIAVDQCLSEWKNCLRVNQYITDRSAALDIKTHEVCESRSGYTWKIKMCTNSEPSQDLGPLSGTIPSVVLGLLKGLENKGHTVWMDNYYNSPALARILKSLKFDCVGTLRTNRRFVPLPLATLQADQIDRGEIAGCTSGDVDLLVWQDKKRVCLISTYHGTAVTQAGEAQKPTLIHDYNYWMGCFDNKEKKLAAYPIERKRSKVWYKKLFRRLLNTSVLNAYLLFKHTSVNTEHYDFRIELIRQILELHHKGPRPAQSLKTFTIQDTKRYVFTEEVLKHFPLELGLLPGGAKMRRKCVVCGARSLTICPGCNKALCVFASSRNDFSSPTETCFRLYHSKR